MKIKGIEGLTMAQIDAELAAGGRFVFYEYCISLIFVTLRRPTSIRLLRAGDRGVVWGLPFVLLSLLLGWWGVPWGLIYTPMAIFANLGGGRDVTLEVRHFLEVEQAEQLVGLEEAIMPAPEAAIPADGGEETRVTR